MLQFIFLQAQQPGGSAFLSMLFPLLILVVFYFFLIRPQIKRQKETQKFQESLREGLDVITNAGIIGKITKIDGPVVRLMVDEKTFIRVVKSAIQSEYKP
ncbi:MAG: preprotein translocase subunit YajC [Saprospiraceae bacterium]|nr:preprotein translocase subunit YajC [Saprospiraceae bacterium]MCW5921965.1 preprotein translocase subunit YajC [Saprospiraceae bacterium]